MIYVNGDSFTQKSPGAEDYSWSQILEQSVGQTVINQAAGCGSNTRMLSNLYNLHHQGIQPKLVIMALSSFHRWHVPGKQMSSWSIGPTIINDRTGLKDESMLKWWLINAYDKLEFVYQYYNTIWQMHELCHSKLKCPVVFFNAFDLEIYEIEKIVFGNHEQLTQWINQQVDDPVDQSTLNYLKAFEYFQKQSKLWIRDTVPWISFLHPNYIDPIDGEHPSHPSRQGHRLICDRVLSIIKERLPEISQQWSNE